VGDGVAATPYNFETVPIVASRRPLWDLKHPDDPDGPHE
jgi:cytochrome c oxidase subunit 1